MPLEYPVGLKNYPPPMTSCDEVNGAGDYTPPMTQVSPQPVYRPAESYHQPSLQALEDPYSMQEIDALYQQASTDSELYRQSQGLADYRQSADSVSNNNMYREIGDKCESEVSGLPQSLESPDGRSEDSASTPQPSSAAGTPDSGACDRLCDSAAQLDHNNGIMVQEYRKSKGKKHKHQGSGPGRGRPRKTPIVAMYHSQISGDHNTIKIRIRKNITTEVQLTPNKKKSGRRKHKNRSNSGYYDDESPSKKSRTGSDDVSSTQSELQSPWATQLPDRALFTIFQHMCAMDGCLPTLVRLCKVCRSWRSVALLPALWNRIDLNWVKEHCRTDMTLHWLIHNRLTGCQDLNLGEWKIRDISAALESICRFCPDLQGLNLSGWNGLNADHLNYLTTECPKLERVDLSSVNSTSAINAQPLVSLGQTMNDRLTHLVLAHNKIAGFTQIITSLSTHCPNLKLLDISNIKTYAHTTALLHIEKLQAGCPKLRVLRITNSQIRIAPVTLTEQMSSPGFPLLEELSLAGSEEDKTTTSRSVDDDGIERILKASTLLRLLDVRGCSRLTDSSLVRVPAWDLEHLFLSACYVTRAQNSGLELIVQKWSHSLIEVDLAWSTVTDSLDAAVLALAEKGSESRLKNLNLCGSSVSLDPVKAVLMKCPSLRSINLQSCRGLPRGIKRLYTGTAVDELRQSLGDKTKAASGATPDSESDRSPAYPPSHTPTANE